MVPSYFTYSSPDGRFQFRAPYNAANNPGAQPTGMYRSDDLAHPLWTVNWHDEVGWHDSVSVANDGVHVVRIYRPLGIDDPAITLYAQNKAIATFRVKDLVAATRELDIPVKHERTLGELPCAIGIESVRWLKNMEFDDKNRSFSVTTVTGEQVDIALADGNILRRVGIVAPQVNYTIPRPPKTGSKFVVLSDAEKIRGMVLPQGTVVTENSSGSWIKSATLSRSAEYRGVRLAPGTLLNLSNAPLAAEIVRRGRPRQESDKDDFADMEVTSLITAGELSIGKLRVKGLVYVLQGVGGLAVICLTSDDMCHVDDRSVYLAEFWPNLRFRHLELKSDLSPPLPVQVGNDVLRTYDVWYWPNGQVNLISLKDENQRFRGAAAGKMLRFWEDGRPQWWADNLYCRNGEQAATFSLQAGSPEKAVAACADHSIYYVPREALCNGHPEVAIKTFDFLSNRRPSVFQECWEPLPDTVMAYPYAVSANYIPVFVQPTP